MHGEISHSCLHPSIYPSSYIMAFFFSFLFFRKSKSLNHTKPHLSREHITTITIIFPFSIVFSPKRIQIQIQLDPTRSILTKRNKESSSFHFISFHFMRLRLRLINWLIELNSFVHKYEYGEICMDLFTYLVRYTRRYTRK